jgi:hypothetical protein
LDDEGFLIIMGSIPKELYWVLRTRHSRTAAKKSEVTEPTRHECLPFFKYQPIQYETLKTDFGTVCVLNHFGQFTFFQIWLLSEQTFFFMTTAMSRGMISYHHSQKTTLSHMPFSLHISRNDYNSIRMIHETLKELRCCYSSATQHTRLNSAELRPQNFTAISGKMMKY